VIEAVLFDWGDTLVEYEWDDAIADEGTRAGLAALDRGDLPDAMAIGAWFAERTEELFPRDGDDEADLVAIVGHCFGELGAGLADDEVARYLDAAFAAWHRHYRVPVLAHALLESLRGRGLRLALVSNTSTPGRILRPLLAEQGLAQRVDAIVLSCEVGKRKPHPAIFERALEELGVPPERALHVGDRLDADVLGASRLGMTTVQALWFRADDELDGVEPDHQAFTMHDVLNVTRRLRGET
jgi:putative hydrolase of the HAD superfamily